MSAIANFAALKTQVAAFVNRTDLTAQLPVFVGLAESMMRKPPEHGGVRARAVENTVTGTLTGETLAQPSDLLESRRILVGGKNLSYVSPEEYNRLSQRTVTGGYFTIIGSNFYVLGGQSGDDYSLTYIAKFADLSADTDTNALLLNAPEVYLWGSCHQAAIYLKDATAAQEYLTMYRMAVKALNDSEKAAQTTGGPMYIRPERRE